VESLLHGDNWSFYLGKKVRKFIHKHAGKLKAFLFVFAFQQNIALAKFSPRMVWEYDFQVQKMFFQLFQMMVERVQ